LIAGNDGRARKHSRQESGKTFQRISGSGTNVMISETLSPKKFGEKLAVLLKMLLVYAEKVIVALFY
jgi:hypothetical protein